MQAFVRHQGLSSIKYQLHPNAVEPSTIESQPSAAGLLSATELPQLSVVCPNTHDRFNDGMPCNGQNVMSRTAAGTHKPGRPASPHNSTGSVGGSSHVKPFAAATTDSFREQPVHLLERHQSSACHQASYQPHHFRAHDQGLAQPALETEQDGWDDSKPDLPFVSPRAPLAPPHANPPCQTPWQPPPTAYMWA